jgi:hypothetical protein
MEATNKMDCGSDLPRMRILLDGCAAQFSAS